MSKRILVDFEDGVAVVFFQVKGKTHTMAFNNRYDFWAFLEKAPKEMDARVESDNARKKVRNLAAERNISLVEAARIFSEMHPNEAKFIAHIGQSSVKSKSNFDITSIEF